MNEASYLVEGACRNNVSLSGIWNSSEVVKLAVPSSPAFGKDVMIELYIYNTL